MIEYGYMNWKKNYKIILIGFLIIAGVISRFWWLDKFPTGISHDELEYVLSAKNYFYSGNDVSGSRFPASIFTTKTNGVISFLPALLLSPIYGNIKLTQFSVRLPYVILNIATAIIICLLTFKLFNKKEIAGISMAIFLTSPWSFYFSRMASDTAWALFFAVLSIWLMINQKKNWEVWSYLSLMSMFFSYHGAKIIMPLLVMVLALYIGLYKTKRLLIVVFITLIAYGFGLMMTPKSIYNSRQNDIVFLNKTLLSKTVNTQRLLTVNNRLTPFFENKVIVAINIFVNNYLETWSPKVLFTEGDGRATYRFGKYGLLHVFDLILLLVGLIQLIKKQTKIFKLLLSIVLISPVVTAISTVEVSVINRSFLLLPILIIVSAYGLWNIGEWLEKRNIWLWLLVPILIIYCLVRFSFFYFLQWPKINQESYSLSEKIMANYVNKNKTNKIVAIHSEPRAWWLEGYFYSDQKKWINIEEGSIEIYKQNNIEYTDKCPAKIDLNTTYVISNNMSYCFPKNYSKVTINEEEFGGKLISIFNDKLCENINLSPWVVRKISDYNIEKMDVKEFCEKWISKP